MKSFAKLGVVAVGLMAAAVAGGCSGSDGAAGAPGKDGAPGAQGMPGPAGTGTDPSVSVVFPRYGLLDRELDVVVTAEAVKFDATSTADFGMGVTVSAPQVLSPTSLSVHLKIDKAAAVGKRDVVVSVGGKMYTGTGSFSVVAPLQMTLAPGAMPKQGGIFQADFSDLDHTALDPNSITWAGVVSGYPYDFATTPTSTNATFWLLVDPLAPAAKTGLVLENLDFNGNPSATFETASDALTVAANAPTALTIGTVKTDTVAAAGASNLYKYTVAKAGIVHVTFAASGGSLSPVWYAFPGTGVSADRLLQSVGSIFGPGPTDAVYPVAKGDDGYVVVADSSLNGGVAANYGYSLQVTSTDVPAANIVASNNTNHHVAMAQPLAALPAMMTGSTSATATVPSFDYFSFTVTAADVTANRTYEMSGDAYGDTALFICPPGTMDPPDLNACNTFAPEGRISGGDHSSFTTSIAVTAAGTYNVIVLGLYGGPHPVGKYTAGLRATN